MANALLQQRLDGNSISDHSYAIGVNWVSKFYAHHPNIKAVKIRAIDTLRICGSSESRLEEWFEIVHEILPTVPAHNIYNINETGLMIGHMRTAKRIMNINVPIPY